MASRSLTFTALGLGVASLSLAGYTMVDHQQTREDLLSVLAQTTALRGEAETLRSTNADLEAQLARTTDQLNDQGESLQDVVRPTALTALEHETSALATRLEALEAGLDQTRALAELTPDLGLRLLDLESEFGAAQAAPPFADQVRTALMGDPAMLFDAVDAYERQQVEAQVARYSDDLTSDPFIPVLGNPEGDITLVEYFDYNCGYCRRAMDDVMQVVEADGNIRLILKEFPILSPQSQEAAVFAMAAADDLDYMALHQAAMRSPGTVSGQTMLAAAMELGLDPDELQDEVEARQEEYLAALSRTREVAQALGITGTPAFFIEGRVIPGAISAREMQAIIADIRAERDNT